MTEKEIEQIDVLKKERWDRYGEITSALDYGRKEGDFRRLSEIVIRLFKNGYDAVSIVSLLDEPLDIVQKILDEHGNEDQAHD